MDGGCHIGQPYPSFDCNDNLRPVPNCDAGSLDKHLGLERMALVPMHRKVTNARKTMKSETVVTLKYPFV